jgi:hypothetical protein
MREFFYRQVKHVTRNVLIDMNILVDLKDLSVLGACALRSAWAHI